MCKRCRFAEHRVCACVCTCVCVNVCVHGCVRACVHTEAWHGRWLDHVGWLSGLQRAGDSDGSPSPAVRPRCPQPCCTRRSPGAVTPHAHSVTGAAVLLCSQGWGQGMGTGRDSGRHCHPPAHTQPLVPCPVCIPVPAGWVPAGIGDSAQPPRHPHSTMLRSHLPAGGRGGPYSPRGVPRAGCSLSDSLSH